MREIMSAPAFALYALACNGLWIGALMGWVIGHTWRKADEDEPLPDLLTSVALVSCAVLFVAVLLGVYALGVGFYVGVTS